MDAVETVLKEWKKQIAMIQTFNADGRGYTDRKNM